MVTRNSIFSMLMGVLLALMVGESATAAGPDVDRRNSDEVDQVVHDVIAHKLQKPYYKPGANPCDPKGGCTPEWVKEQVIKQMKWPEKETEILFGLAKTTAGAPYQMEYKWEGWMSGGGSVGSNGQRTAPEFHKLMVAVWSAGESHTEEALHWEYKTPNGQFVYHLLKIDACGNWAGWRDRSALIIDYPTVTGLSLGVIPTVTCVP